MAQPQPVGTRKLPLLLPQLPPHPRDFTAFRFCLEGLISIVTAASLCTDLGKAIVQNHFRRYKATDGPSLLPC